MPPLPLPACAGGPATKLGEASGDSVFAAAASMRLLAPSAVEDDVLAVAAADDIEVDVACGVAAEAAACLRAVVDVTVRAAAFDAACVAVVGLFAADVAFGAALADGAGSATTTPHPCDG